MEIRITNGSNLPWMPRLCAGDTRTVEPAEGAICHGCLRALRGGTGIIGAQ